MPRPWTSKRVSWRVQFFQFAPMENTHVAMTSVFNIGDEDLFGRNKKSERSPLRSNPIVAPGTPII